ncbi:MAG TPA: serine hydrolase domain-containing protein [Pyrinomonadaceae bacterium]|jgi:CubicO group peptidase (beta-lactamase class C family)
MEFCRVFLLLLPLLHPMTDDKPAGPKSSQVDAVFREFAQPGVPGASVMVIRDGKVLFKKAYGLANLEDKTPCATDTNYRLASLTKQFTAAAVMLLAERGKLSYDSTLTDFFPDFPDYGRQITVRHLLNHTSGLTDYEDLIPKETTAPLKDRQVLELLKRERGTYFPPGSRFQYSNSGYALLALIVEAVSRTTFAAFLEKNIFQPLGMRDTVAYEDGVSSVRRRAYGYWKRTDGPGGFVRRDQSLTSSVLGDGGIYSSVEDLYRWDQALYTDRLVSRASLAEAFTPGVRINGEGEGYGFGWFVATYRGLNTLWHYGSTTGFRTAIERFPGRRFTVIVLVNRNEADAHALARKLVDLYLFDGQ